MKALVLAGGYPQIELIKKLQERGIETVLADYYQEPIAKKYADKFYQISTLDENGIKILAEKENVDFIITVCTDQALLTMAKVSEELSLPCYIDYETARRVTNKAYMKEHFIVNKIPTSLFYVSSELNKEEISKIGFPLIVKPVDCNSSKGVRRVDTYEDLKKYFDEAREFSRTNTVIVEKFVNGKELSVDVYVENGNAIVLDITTSEKLKIRDRFIIFRTWHPANISDVVKDKTKQVAQQIADAFGIHNAPMLIQMLTDGENVFVIEFSARTGGGLKYQSIFKRTGVDIISTVIDLTLGINPHIKLREPIAKYMVDEYLYCKEGVFNHAEGFDELIQRGIISECHFFCLPGTKFKIIENSGDRVGGITIEGNTIEELREKHDLINKVVKVISNDNEDIMQHKYLMSFNEY